MSRKNGLSVLENIPNLIFPRVLPLNFKFGKVRLVLKKGGIHRVIYFPSNWRVTLVSLFIRGVTKEDAFERLGIKFGAVLLVDVKEEQPKTFSGKSEKKRADMWIGFHENMTWSLEF